MHKLGKVIPYNVIIQAIYSIRNWCIGIHRTVRGGEGVRVVQKHVRDGLNTVIINIYITAVTRNDQSIRTLAAVAFDKSHDKTSYSSLAH